jgi:hypothetical protein
VAVLVSAAAAAAQPVGTRFTYQGRLTDGASPASGTYDMEFALFDAATGPGGDGLGGVSVAVDDVVVTQGLFTVLLDYTFFPNAFQGTRVWIETRVRPGASTGAYTTLTPRQELTPATQAVFSTAAPWTGLTGVPAGFADGVDDDSGGDVTAVTAGAGLAGGGASGALTISASFGGGGSADTVARSDHDHAFQTWSAAASASAVLTAVNTGAGGFTDGFFGVSNAAGNGRGVVGYATATTGTNYGVWGQIDSSTGRAVFGTSTSTAGTSVGVYGETRSIAGSGVFGDASGVGVGVQGRSQSNIGVWGTATATSGLNYGVQGTSSSTAGVGVIGRALAASGTTYSIFGDAPSSPSGYSGYFAGRVNVVGVLSKGGGAFKIDHPLDPENKYLYHSFVESPDMMNVYNGNVITDDEGYATVELPDWFEALNRDFRYQLTVIGQFAQAIVSRKVEGNRFEIRTNVPDVEVSWQVTGIRKDPFAEKNRIPVEEDKPQDERGRYLHPDAWGQPAEKGLDHGRRPPND